MFLLQRPPSRAEIVDDALRAFSRDLVKIVLGYLMCAPATAGAKPELLLTIGSDGTADGQFTDHCYGIACSPDGKVWVSSGLKVSVFSDEGKFLHLAAPGLWNMPRGIAFTHHEAFVADYGATCIVVCRLDGGFIRRIVACTHAWPQHRAVCAASALPALALAPPFFSSAA